MYYTKPNGFGSARNGGSFNRNNSFNRRPSRGRFGSGPRRSQLINQDINIFIKKAVGQILQEDTPSGSFKDFDLATPLRANIENKGYLTPTPIQAQAIPAILQGRDLVGSANTGTGKTAAFLIPIINKIFKDRNQKALIIAPTRELAAQINQEFRDFSIGMQLYSTIVIGGANMHRQISELRRNPHLVVGTPGRLKDLIEKRALNLKDFSIFVLDEVDLMVDIGFINDVKFFMQFLPTIRQSLFFSATISSKISGILQAFVKDPVTVSVSQQRPAENVDQDVVKVINSAKKVDQLHDLLIQDGFDKVLIFGQTKHGIEKLHRELESRGFRTGSIHGNKNQSQRQRVLRSFKEDQIQILLATDVASRGLDIPDVSHVINYDLPQTYDDYIHRIGRTGRAGKTGIALTFVG